MYSRNNNERSANGESKTNKQIFGFDAAKSSDDTAPILLPQIPILVRIIQ